MSKTNIYILALIQIVFVEIKETKIKKIWELNYSLKRLSILFIQLWIFLYKKRIESQDEVKFCP